MLRTPTGSVALAKFWTQHFPSVRLARTEGDDMPRYFFHIETQDFRFSDPDGQDLVSLNAAHEYALRLIDKTTQLVGLPKDVRWTVNICDPVGESVLVVMFPVYSPGWFGGPLNGHSSVALT